MLKNQKEKKLVSNSYHNIRIFTMLNGVVAKILKLVAFLTINTYHAWGGRANTSGQVFIGGNNVQVCTLKEKSIYNEGGLFFLFFLSLQ